MSEICEVIAKQNLNLKNSKSVKNTCETILQYLKIQFKIVDIIITVIKVDEKSEEIIFASNNNIQEEEHNTFELIQNENTKIKVSCSYEDESYLIENRCVLDLALQVFSQTIFIRLLNDTLKDLTLIDNVTGLYNRHYLDNYAGNILNISNRESKKVAFLKIGIDQFKAVIDEFDYNVGDKVLKALADILKTTVRSSDIVVKIDGDEFLVILMNIINSDNAIMISEKIINNFSEEKVLVNEQTEQVLKKTVCAGITLFPDDASEIDDIIRKTDIALYEARNLGRSKSFKYIEEEANSIDFF